MWRATVTRLDENGRPFVTIERLARNREYGPLEQLETTTPLVPGHRVLCGFIEGRPDDPIVLGRLV